MNLHQLQHKKATTTPPPQTNININTNATSKRHHYNTNSNNTSYIFESNMVQLLLGLFPQAPFRNVALQCLTEVASLSMDAGFDDRFRAFFKAFSQQLHQILPPGTNVEAAYAAGTDEQQAFVQNLALFYTSFFRVRGGGLGFCYERRGCSSVCAYV